MRTEAKNYSIKYDGTVEVDPSDVPTMLMRGLSPEQITVTSENEDIREFNRRSSIPIQLVSDDLRDLSIDWKVPDEYLNIDLRSYVLGLNRDQSDASIARIENELAEIKRRGLDELFKTIIYIVDDLTKRNVVWGVGRGSSCASYVLYLIGLHSINPLKYEIPMVEFYHD